MLCFPGSTVDDCLPKPRRHPCATHASWCVFVRLIVVCMDTWKKWPCCCKSHTLEQNRVQKRAKTRVQKRAKTRVQQRPDSANVAALERATATPESTWSPRGPRGRRHRQLQEKCTQRLGRKVSSGQVGRVVKSVPSLAATPLPRHRMPSVGLPWRTPSRRTCLDRSAVRAPSPAPPACNPSARHAPAASQAGPCIPPLQQNAHCPYRPRR